MLRPARDRLRKNPDASRDARPQIDAVSALDLARWQFAVTTLYHFLFVPVTIGLAWFVAGFQTAWYRTGDERWLRTTRFFGKLFLINFALGVVTGIVQEFQFGMNWSAYSKYVGDIFGAPLAMEGLAAFFLESTFLGLWIFGWDRLKPKVHLATIWLVAIGTTMSAYFILAANSWMQHPVGYKLNPVTHRAEMTSIVADPHQLDADPRLRAHDRGGRPHRVDARARRRRLAPARGSRRRALFAPVARIALWVTLVGAVATVLLGHEQGQLMTKQQPMKMAAAEALYKTKKGAPFSLFDIGPWQRRPDEVARLDRDPARALDPRRQLVERRRCRGSTTSEAEYVAKYGPGDYRPIVGVDYWSFRIMTGLGFLALLIAAAGLWLARVPGRLERSPPLPARRRLGDRAAARRQPRRLALHRDGPPAVGRAGAAPDEERRLADRRPLVGRADARRLHRASTACSPSSKALLMIRAAKAGPEPKARSSRRPRTTASPIKLPALTY